MQLSNRVGIVSRLAMLIAIGLILWIFEELIPYPFPFLKLGLGNIVVLYAVMTMKARHGIIVSILRVLLGALILGRLLSPVFIFSIVGAISSVTIMLFLHRTKLFSIIGISIAGALGHNLAQLILSIMLFYKTKTMLYFMPFLAISSVIGGLIIAFIAFKLISRL